MTMKKRWLGIAGAVVAAALIGGAIWMGVTRAEDEPTTAQQMPPLETPNTSPTPAPSEPDTTPDAEPTPSDDVPDPASIEGAIEVEGVWYVPCSSEYAGDTEVSDGICYLEGANDSGDAEAASGSADAFMDEWMQLDTDETWEARDERLAPLVTDDFTAPFPELAWEERYDQAGTLTFRAEVLSADISQSVPPQLVSPGTYTTSYLVTYEVEWTLPSGEVNSSRGYGVWQVTTVDGLVDEVNEPDLVES